MPVYKILVRDPVACHIADYTVVAVSPAGGTSLTHEAQGRKAYCIEQFTEIVHKNCLHLL